MKAVLFLLTLVALPAWAQVQVENAWIRPTAPGAKVAAGYMTLRNASAGADRLVSATTAAAEKVETHVTMKDGDILRMREVKGYEIPAKGSFELKPGGAHLMLVNIKAPMVQGQKVQATLRFEKSGEQKVEFTVRQPAPAGHDHKGH
jgi:periplasmic copper chaperone A